MMKEQTGVMSQSQALTHGNEDQIRMWCCHQKVVNVKENSQHERVSEKKNTDKKDNINEKENTDEEDDESPLSSVSQEID
ncbi:hypothetical protein EMPG_13052 [Blastomyces silverae]|uniref:Uncharacterized protein n=1 Tax=Blastomyces silverae TaxID=2060906 RepID=A0A0H1BL16_9EURO|nr:hypothetical protein EMPG_13052 [Blastomyces silverae]